MSTEKPNPDSEEEQTQEEMETTRRHEYWKTLYEAEGVSQDSYDKTLITLSGGALGLSLTFVEKLVGAGDSKSEWLLVVAWTLWSLCLTTVLASFWLSQKALRRSLRVLSDGKSPEEAEKSRFSTLTEWANGTSGVFFLLGLFAMIWFVFLNRR